MTTNHQFSKSDILMVLRDLRQEIEQDTGNLNEDQALLLVDVCQALGFDEDESHTIIGQAFDLITQPVPVRIVPTSPLMYPTSG